LYESRLGTQRYHELQYAVILYVAVLFNLMPANG